MTSQRMTAGALVASIWLAAVPASRASSGREALAELELARGDWPAAAHHYALAAGESGDVALAERATRAAWDHFQYAAAATAAARWRALAPGEEVPRRYLATALLRGWHVDASAAEFRALLETAYPDRARGYGALLEILADEPDEVAAARVIEQLAAGDATVAEAQYARSVLWQRADNGARALAAAREAIRLRPDWTLARLAEARALLTLERTDEALSLVRSLSDAGDAVATLNYAWFLLGAERWAEARAVLERLAKERGNVPEVLEALGTIDYEQKNYEAALGRFGEMLRSARAADAGFWYVGLIAEKQGDKRLAARSLARVTGGARAVGAQVRAYRLLGEDGQSAAAAALLDDFLAAYPDRAPAVVAAQASLLAEQQRGDEARSLIGRARTFFPDDKALAITESVVLERLDRIDECVRLLRALLAVRPGDPDLQNSLGYTLVDRTSHTAEGHALIDAAFEQRPDNFAVIDSLGWALYKLGRPVEALPYLERSWRRARDAEVAWHLGSAYLALGRRDDARAVLVAAEEGSPDDRHLARLRESLRP